VVNASLILLQKLKVSRFLGYDDLLKHLKKSINGGEFLFLPALNFLYLLELVEYRRKTDSFEITERT
jgi:hypothetical protein